MRLCLAALLGALSLVIALPSPAMACSCVQAGPPEYVAWADVVVSGEVVAQDGPISPTTSMETVTITVAVDEVFKGTSGPTLAVSTAASGASCGLEGLQTGQRYVFFASPSEGGLGPQAEQEGLLWATICGGTAPATTAFVAAVAAQTGPGRLPGGPDPAGSSVTDPGDPGDPADAGDSAIVGGTGGSTGGGDQDGSWFRLSPIFDSPAGGGSAFDTQLLVTSLGVMAVVGMAVGTALRSRRGL